MTTFYTYPQPTPKDSQLAREIEVALPRELDRGQSLDLLRAFVQSEFTSVGMVADVCVHEQKGWDGVKQPHAHILLTMREIVGDGFGKKERAWNGEKGKDILIKWRERWGELTNDALERAGAAARVDHRSYTDRGIDQEPQPKLGYVALALESRGIESDRGDMLRAVKERNVERSRMREALRSAKQLAVDMVQRSADALHQGTDLAKEKIAKLFRRSPRDDKTQRQGSTRAEKTRDDHDRER